MFFAVEEQSMVDQFNVATNKEIIDGKVTDEYFKRTEEALVELESNPQVTAEITADQFEDGEKEVFCGLKEAIELLNGGERYVSLDIDMYAIDEGETFDGNPVMLIQGPYREFARFETPLLGLLSQASGYATEAARIVDAAGNTPVLSFGSRHIHPALAPYMERAAAVGGVDGYSNAGASPVMDDDPSGTIPHALMLSQGQGNQEQAWQAFNESAPDDTDRIILADTFTDEVDEALRAAEELGDDLDGVRLDTTGSRRGDFKHIIREVRHELDMIGRVDVDIYVSGGIDADAVTELREFCDGFGVGSAITNADPIDFGLDIVRVENDPCSKRGKLSGVSKNPPTTPYIEDGEVVNDAT